MPRYRRPITARSVPSVGATRMTSKAFNKAARRAFSLTLSITQRESYCVRPRSSRLQAGTRRRAWAEVA
jgi:hypothetical protein